MSERREETINSLAGQTIGQYEVREKLAEGGMASVYRAYQPMLGREVALKVLSRALADEPGFLQRFANEARTLARLDHPNILPVYDFGSYGDVTYIATPLVGDGTLDALMEKGRVDLSLSLAYLNQIADALHHAHDVGVIHRDLKPSNILVHSDGRVLLADFGLARMSDQAGVTMTGSALGTPGYMAPEQAVGGLIDERTDIYALGVVAFQLLTGSRPYGGSARTMVTATIQAPIPSCHQRNPHLPGGVDAVFQLALAKKPVDRPATALEFVRLLNEALAPIMSAPAADWAVDVAGTMVLPREESAKVSASGEPPEVVTPWPPVTPTPAPATPTGDGDRAAPQDASTPVGLPMDVLVERGLVRVEASGRLLQNDHFSNAFHAATYVAGDHWLDLVSTAGLPYLLSDPPEGAVQGVQVHELAWLNEAMEVTFGSHAAEHQRRWGGVTMQLEIERTPSLSAHRRLVRMMAPGHQRRMRKLLQAYCDRMDAVRGEKLHSWMQIDSDQFWIAVQGNPYVFGKRKPQPSCHAIVGQLATLLRWVGLANDWLVEEVECGCVTGSSDCVFAIRSANKG